MLECFGKFTSLRLLFNPSFITQPELVPRHVSLLLPSKLKWTVMGFVRPHDILFAISREGNTDTTYSKGTWTN